MRKAQNSLKELALKIGNVAIQLKTAPSHPQGLLPSSF